MSTQKLIHVYLFLCMSSVFPVWSPSTQKWINKVEQIQKRALRMIPSLKGKSYEQKLKHLSMLSLENRRIMFDLINKFKEESEKKNVLSQGRSTTITRSKTDKQLEKPKFRLDLRKIHTMSELSVNGIVYPYILENLSHLVRLNGM